MRIAMWSGPRNLSTAMMYAFASRGDCAVWDEPFYAAYLDRTGLKHPMRAESMAAGERDPDKVADACVFGPVPEEKPHFLQKHMAQHMLPGFDRGWLSRVVNIFLIRHPARVIASFSAKHDSLGLDDIGFRSQLELYRAAAACGQTPVVLDSADIRSDPAAALEALCDSIGLPWTPAMLSWPAGPKPFDGVWASHWYDSLHRSSGFAGPEGPLPAIEPALAQLHAEALPFYEELRLRRLRVDSSRRYG